MLRVSDSRPRTTKEKRMPNDHQSTGEPGGCSARPACSGLYVTPPHIVDYILSDGTKIAAKVYDPTQGTGAFLLTAAKQLAGFCDRLQLPKLTADNPLAADGNAALDNAKKAISDFERIMCNPPFSAPNSKIGDGGTPFASSHG
jgi:hypothetical protein